MQSKNSKYKPRVKILLSGALALLISGCASGPTKQVDPSIPLPEHFSISGVTAVENRWWLGLNDPELSLLIEQALAKNYNLQALYQRLEQKSALLAKSGAAAKVQVDGRAGISESVTVAGNTATSEALTLGLSASYELDLWGKVAAGVEAQRLAFAVSQQELQAAAISLSAEVAISWYRVVEQRNQVAKIAELIYYNKEYLQILSSRARYGRATPSDLLQQELILESTREQMIRQTVAQKTLEHQLAVLLGAVPGAQELPKRQLFPALPPLPQTGVPAKIMQQRPDIRSRYLAVQVENRLVAVAIAAQYPRVSFSAGIGTSETTKTTIFTDWVANLAANLVMPIFDAGARKAEVARSQAVLNEEVKRYGQAVLVALKEVEDALAKEAAQGQLIASLEQQDQLTNASIELMKESYRQGKADFAQLLGLLYKNNSLQRNRIVARRELVEYRIALYRALGGSFEQAQEQVTK